MYLMVNLNIISAV